MTSNKAHEHVMIDREMVDYALKRIDTLITYTLISSVALAVFSSAQVFFLAPYGFYSLRLAIVLIPVFYVLVFLLMQLNGVYGYRGKARELQFKLNHLLVEGRYSDEIGTELRYIVEKTDNRLKVLTFTIIISWIVISFVMMTVTWLTAI